MILQDAMRKVSVAYQLYRASVFTLKPLRAKICTGMIMQCFVHASDILDH